MGLLSARRSLSSVLAGAVLVTAATASGPTAFAADPDPGVDRVLGFLGSGGGAGTLAAWASGLGSVGKLAEPLPLVGASPGGLLGLDDLVQKAVADELSGATWDAIDVDKDIAIGGGRTGHLTSNVVDDGAGKRVNIVVTIDKQVTGGSLALSNESPKVELSVKDAVTIDIEARLALSVVWTGTSDNKVYLVADAASPRLDVDAAASIDAANAKAAVGILGVTLDGSTLAMKAHLVGRVDDPDNDGRLSLGPGGELTPDGSLDGLLHVGLDATGSDADPGSRGSVHATFNLGAAAGGIAGLSLPSTISSTITVDWPDIGTGTPTVSAPDLAATVGKFQNMSLRDLADGLAQVVTSITAIQKAKFDPTGGQSTEDLIGDLDLPFMKGTVSDAIEANAALVDFLKEWVVQSPEPGDVPAGFDPATVGQPKFSSLQDLLTRLEQHAGISLGNLAWDPATSKLAFDLQLSQSAPATPQDLDELSVLASGAGATYSADGLAIGTSPWETNQWAGLRIVAGNSAGVITSNTASGITLESAWIGGKPNDSSPFVIIGSQPNIGAVTLADTVQDGGGHGLVNANADQTFAKVTPSYTTTLTLVLDLQDPKTGAACNGFEGSTQACPFTLDDGPFSTHVESLPLNTDRVMIRTGKPLLTADFPIETAVDFTANAGFFKVRVQGNLKVCNKTATADCTGAGTGHMLTIDLADQGDLRLGKLFAMLVKPAGEPSGASDLLDVDLNVKAVGSMSVSVPDAADFLPSGASAQLGVRMGDITDPDSIVLDTSDLDEIFELDFDANDPQALFTLVVKTLQTLSKQLAEANPGAGSGVFDKEIPGVGRSLRDLLRSDQSNQGSSVSYGNDTLGDTATTFGPEYVGRAVVVGTQVALVQAVQDSHTLKLTSAWGTKPADGTAYMFRSPLDDAVDSLLASPPQNIQDLVKILNDRLGNDTLGFRYLDDGGTPSLVLDLAWDRGYRTSSPVSFDLGDIGGAAREFVGAEASGNVDVNVAGAVDVGLVVPLAAGPGPDSATSLKVLEDSSINVHAGASFTGNVKGTIGPLSLALGQPGGDASTQAKAAADVSLDLAKSGAAEDNPVSFSTFVSGVQATFNGSSNAVECGENLETPLMVCGRLPLYVSAAGSANTWTAAGQIALRLPKSTTPSDLTDITGSFDEGGTTYEKLDVPDDLATQIANAVLDFNNLGQGLEGYLTLIEQSFRLAAFDGKLPLVGEDLQQGADFIGDLRTTLQESIFADLPGAGRPLNADEVVDFINEKLEEALNDAGMDVADLEVGLVCVATLGSAGAPTVTPTGGASATWEYQVVSYQGDGSGTGGDAIPSTAGTTSAGAATLDATHYNSLSWAKVDGATGYKILRKAPGESAFTLLAKVTSGLTYVDKNQDGAAAAAYTPVTANPTRTPCPASGVDGVTLGFTVSQGVVSGNDGCTNPTGGGQPCISEDIPLDIGIPGLSLKGANEDDPDANGIRVKFGYALHFQVGLSKEDGFFVSTHDGWGDGDKARPELQVGLGFDLPDKLAAELSFLNIDISKAEDATAPLFAGAFQIDLRSSASDESCWKGDEDACEADDTAILTFADLRGASVKDLFGISLIGKVDIDWDIVADVDSAFPGVRTNFNLDWILDTNAEKPLGAPTIVFDDVAINAGEFFTGLLGPVVKEIKRVTGPMQPVIDTLYAPIPVLSDLSRMAGGDDVTLVTLAKTFNTLAGGPSLKFVDTVKAVIEFINRLPECKNSDDCYIPLGSFTVSGAKALETSATPTSGAGLIDTSPGKTIARTAEQIKNDLNNANQNPKSTGKPLFKTGSGPAGDTEKAGFAFPIIDDPMSAFALLMGDDVELVSFDSGPLTLGFSWRQSFGPVYAPPPVMVTLSGSASVTLRVMAGLDTAGIRHAVEAAQGNTSLDPVALLDGLYFKTVDASGNPVPVVQLDGEIAAGAAVSAVIITVGIEGGLRLTVGFYWNDPNDDGKFRVSEFLQAAINNPICLFTTTGRLSLFLRVYITLGFSPFSVSFSFTLADVTLLDFTAQADCTPPPPRLGGVTGDGTTLVVYAGDFGKDGNRGAPWGNAGAEDETVKVTALHFAQTESDPTGEDNGFDGFAVDMIGEHREYLDPALERVVIDGSSYDKPMKVTLIGDGKKTGDDGGAQTTEDLSRFNKDAIVFGGSADDTIQTGTARSYVDGGAGNDVIVTADRGGSGSFAHVAGGPGNDTITTGNGDNHVAGDGSLGTAVLNDIQVTHSEGDGGGTAELDGIVNWGSLDDPTAGADPSTGGDDTIGVGLGNNVVRGNGGADKIGVATDLPDGTKVSQGNTLVGGYGADRITGGSGDDRIFTSTEGEFGVDADGPDDSGTDNVVDTGTGNDKVWGSKIQDVVQSSSKKTQSARIIGGAGSDALMGGFGTDAIFGGPGNDYVIAEPAQVKELGAADVIEGVSFGASRAVTKLPLPAGTTPSSKTLVGGTGNDHIIGGDGPATIFGDTLRSTAVVSAAQDETCRAGASVASDAVPEGTTAADGDGNDLILGGAGVDTVSAGGGSDRAYGYGEADLLCGQHGTDVLFGGTGGDSLWGGSGNDRGYGEDGDDLVFGNADDDFLYGQAGADVLEGDNGTDWVSGGVDDDLVYGGTRAAGRTDTDAADRGDDLFGDAGNDRIIGDNGTVGTLSTAIPFDLDGTTADAGRGDRISGGDGTDTAYGGLGDDSVNGNNDDDHLEGNNGADTVHGDAGEDAIVGGSFQEAATGVGRPDTGDTLFGDAGADLIAGDNAVLAWVGAAVDSTPVTRNRGFLRQHQVTLLDLGDSPAAGTSGHDLVSGGDGQDVVYGQGGDDRVKGDGDDDYAEGGPGTDWLEGNDGADDLVGGSSTMLSVASANGQPDAGDAVFGGPGDDVATGDNAVVTRGITAPTRVTVRLGSTPGAAMTPRTVALYDLATLSSVRYGADQVSGGAGLDVIWGQDGADALSGGSGDDYVEGNGGPDQIRGDRALDASSANLPAVPAPTNASWPGTATVADVRDGADVPDGQDDLIGGSSAKSFRDGDDQVEGNGGDDVVLGDNGSLVRTLEGAAGARTEKVYADRFPNTPVAGTVRTVSRVRDVALGDPSTRFCTEVASRSTCEPTGAFGADRIFGDAGNDGLWGQDGNDLLHGGIGDDDMYGELGDDTMFGEAGEDAMLGDRGGVVNQYLDTGDAPATTTTPLTQPPAESYTAFLRGSYDRRVDLLHDVDGDAWVGTSTAAPMPYDGFKTGGRDRMRGGSGADNLHGGFGDDLMNGDSGGDQLFGADGEDVMWGGRGCDPSLDAATPDCLVNGVFTPSARGTNDRFVDHLFGGAGEPNAALQDVAGSDVLDFNPRGTYPGGCSTSAWPVTLGNGKNATTVDPCVWFEMTGKDTATLADNQHHHGTDWIYGGWDRDVMQGNVAQNGPNPGDRLIDWTGVYNLYTHCNAAYGGFNDVRLFAPAMESFLKAVAYGSGAGRAAGDVATPGTSAFRELAFVYTGDLQAHGSGKAYPTTPGHFDEVSCEE